MKKITIKVLIFFTAVLIYSCNNNKTENNDKAEEYSSKLGLSLDNGKLWTANTETTTGVNNMIALLNNFDDEENIEAYAELTTKLKLEFATIFEKCTMKGEAHNQLHHFLVPIKNLLKNLSSNDLNKCKESYSKLNTHLSVYKTNFK